MFPLLMWRAFFLSFFLVVGNLAKEPLSSEKILQYIEANLPHHGVLEQEEKGLIYLKIDDGYIHEIFPLIEEEGFEKPPYFGREGLIGAHISVAYAKKRKKVPKEILGQIVPFSAKQCNLIRTKQGKRLYLILVESEALQAIRKEFSLGKPKHKDHITVGIQKKRIQ